MSIPHRTPQRDRALARARQPSRKAAIFSSLPPSQSNPFTSSAHLFSAAPPRSLVDQWVDFACASITSGVTFEPTLASLDSFLASRTFFVGYAVSLADVAVWHAIVSARQWEIVAKKSADKLPHLLRWFNHLQGSCPAIPDATARCLTPLLPHSPFPLTIPTHAHPPRMCPSYHPHPHTHPPAG